jgi:hypothetical protein
MGIWYQIGTDREMCQSGLIRVAVGLTSTGEIIRHPEVG